MKKNSHLIKLGCTLIIAGTAIGAGMLSIPFVVAGLGFAWAMVALLINGLVMYATAVIMVEVNIRQPLGTDMNKMAKNTLGKLGQILNWVFYYLLLYALTTAYILMGGQLIQNYILSYLLNINFLSFILFTVFFGVIVYLGTRLVDRCNRFFFGLKLIAFTAVFLLLIGHVKAINLDTPPVDINYIWYSFPILITSFGFHIVIPALRDYLNNDDDIKKVVKIGAIIPIVIYVLWIIITLGVLPLCGQYGFISLIHDNQNIGYAYTHYLNSSSISFFIILFENVAIITSFLGVTLALFNYNRDTYKLDGSTKKRLTNFGITYIPPIIFAIFFIDNFITALGYASIFVAVILIIIPALSTWVVRKNEDRLTIKGRILLGFLVLMGLFIIILQILTVLGLLPYLDGTLLCCS